MSAFSRAIHHRTGPGEQVEKYRTVGGSRDDQTLTTDEILAIARYPAAGSVELGTATENIRRSSI